VLRSDIESFFGDVDTIQELSDILILNSAGLLNERACLRNIVQVDALYGKGGNIVFRSDDLRLAECLDGSRDLLTDEVLNIERGAVVVHNSLDREMRVREPHLVLEARRDTAQHVLDARGD